MPQSARLQGKDSTITNPRHRDSNDLCDEGAPITTTRARVGSPVHSDSKEGERDRQNSPNELPTVFETEIRKHFALHRPGSKIGNYSGFLSTTFTPEVFSAVFDTSFRSLFGFHVAVRPTDLDGGSHLPQFLQAYVVQRASSEILSSELKDRITSALRGILSRVIPGFDGLDLEFHGYEWDAISTGYQGTAHEVNVRSISIAGQSYEVEGLEVAQYNHFQSAGGIEGEPTELIVFGIDRMHYFKELAERLTQGAEPEPRQRHHARLYPREISCDAMLDHFEQLGREFRAPMVQTLSDNLRSIEEQLALRATNNRDARSGELRELFLTTSRISTDMEVGYSGRALNSELRTFFTRRLSRIYNAFAKRLRDRRGDGTFFAEFAHLRTEESANVSNASSYYHPRGAGRPEADPDLLVLAASLVSEVHPEATGSIVRKTKTLMLANLLRADFSEGAEGVRERARKVLAPAGDWESRYGLWPHLTSFVGLEIPSLDRLLSAIATEDAFLTGVVHPQLKGRLLDAAFAMEDSVLAQEWRSAFNLSVADRATVCDYFHHKIMGGEIVNKASGETITDPVSLFLIALKNIDGTLAIYQAGFVPTSSADVFFARQKLKLVKTAADQLGWGHRSARTAHRRTDRRTSLDRSSRRLGRGQAIHRRARFRLRHSDGHEARRGRSVRSMP